MSTTSATKCKHRHRYQRCGYRWITSRSLLWRLPRLADCPRQRYLPRDQTTIIGIAPAACKAIMACPDWGGYPFYDNIYEQVNGVARTSSSPMLYLQIGPKMSPPPPPPPTGAAYQRG